MNLKKISMLLGFWFLLYNPALAETSVWKISKGNRHLYMGGTVHVLSKADYPLPPSFEKAYHLSHSIVLETDMQKLQDPEFQQHMIAELSYTGGRSLADVLSAETFQKLEDYCTQRGIPLEGIVHFKPGLVSTVLLITELQRLGLVGEGVDDFYYTKAIGDQKKLGKLETAEAQVQFMATMGQGKEDEMIEYALSDIADLSKLMTDLKLAWRTGDMQSLKEIAIQPYFEKFPETFDVLLNQRNTAWVPKIESLLKTAEVEFVLVGVLHFVGEQGLLAQLKARGYKIEHF